MSDAEYGLTRAAVRGTTNGMLIDLGHPISESRRMRWMLNCLRFAADEYDRLSRLQVEDPTAYAREVEMGPMPTITVTPAPSELPYRDHDRGAFWNQNP